MTATPLTRDEFEQAYNDYMTTGGYSYEEWEMKHEWARYARGRSWFLYTFHGPDALAVASILSNKV